MTPKHFYLLLLALIAIGNVGAQNEDELQIPVENDNQFPPDKHADTIDGSGDGVLEEPEETDVITTTTGSPIIENIQTKLLLDEIGATKAEDKDQCPTPCVCRIEGNDFIVDCSGYDLTEFPSLISDKATILNLQNNKLTEIPKEISSLKNLNVLNANDNLITDLAPGSVSELPALVTLKLGNNRLIEYPNDLKNSFGLTKLEELDLGGNDMRTALSSDFFSIFEALRTITLPSSTPELQQNLCDALPDKLENVCTESCKKHLFECREVEEGTADDLPVLPGMLPSAFDEEDSNDPIVDTPKTDDVTDDKTEVTTTISTDEPAASTPKSTPQEFSFRSAVNKQPSDEDMHNSIVEAPKDVTSTPNPAVKVGATTSDTKTGGVDKSIIGLVVAGMVVIVAGITIKKNWSSIKKRFSSNSRTPNGTNANGTSTTPEEVPLQDKSPV